MEFRYDREQRQIDEALTRFPRRFTLRAFPEAVCRVAPRLAHFVLHGEVQIIVQTEHDGQWRDFGRDSVANVIRELREVPEET